eukprot:GHRQ01025821.1.p2 GENE.GHRQ01025821.1~~GHRQ01025821.1.p2  ORF type:complete len:149 (+),score=31.46 GHRQ01025821.1:106-552(+)
MGHHMIEQAQKHLGQSLMGFELGNEVSRHSATKTVVGAAAKANGRQHLQPIHGCSNKATGSAEHKVHISAHTDDQHSFPRSSMLSPTHFVQPEFWPTGLGGYDEKGKWQSGFEAYAAYFHRVASELNPCSDGKPILSGPGWGERAVCG